MKEKEKKFEIGIFTTLKLGVLAVAITFTLLLLFAFVYKGYINNTQIGNFGSIGDFLNGIITPFISAISAILIYIAFKQ